MLTGIIRGQRLMLRTPIVVADSINYLTAKFTFDTDWTGRTVTAYFVCGDKAMTAELTDGEITAAQGINLTAGRWELKLSGIKGDSRVTAGPVQFDVLPFGATEGELPDISLTQYEKLLAKIGDMDELTTTDKDTLVAAINEAAQSGGGSGGGGLPAGGTPGQVLTRTASGSAWQDGTPGPVGPQGPTGETGATGPEGPQGPEGPAGPQGPEGPAGAQGPAGTGIDIKGTYATVEDLEAAVINPAQGDMYNVGTEAPYTIYMWDTTDTPADWVSQGQLQGPAGATGPQGPAGETGATGPQGETGPAGADGAPGARGDTGPYYTPSVSTEGVISWSNNGGLTNPDPVNIRGPQGETGATGPQGPAGETGATGPQGETGPAGADGAPGARGDTGPYYTPSVSAEGVISWSNNGGLANPGPVNIRGPQGETGATGPQGPTGETGATGPQGETGPAGADGAPGAKGDTGPYYTPSVSAEGVISWSNNGGLANPGPVNIRGPQGETGATGPQGPAGETGATGPQGPEGPTGPQGSEGPNEISTDTASSITGLLKGNGGNVAAAVAGTDYQAPIVETTATLVATDWVVGNYSITQAVSVDGMRQNKKVIISPDINSMEEYLRTGIYCAIQTYNALTFQSTVTTPPTNDLTINVLIMG